MFFRNYQSYKIKSKNILVLYGAAFLNGLMFFAPIWALYIEKSLFSVTNVAIIISIQALVGAVFEVPTGAIADLFGRKRTIMLGYALNLFSVLFLYIGGSMSMFIIYAVLSAMGGALVSGTDGAIIYDTLKDENKENHFRKIVGTYFSLWPFGAVIGSIIGGYLAGISLSFPVLVTLIPLGVAFFLTFLITEPKYEKEEHKNVFKHMLNSSIEISGNKQVLFLFLISFILWSLGESTHLLKSIFFEFKEIPIIYFGYVFAFTYGFSSLGHYFSHNIAEKFGNKKTLVVSVLLDPIFVILATLTFGFTSVLFLVTTSIFFGIRNTVISDMVNAVIDSKKRATILSVESFMRQIGKVIFAPFVGYLADLYSINTAYMVSGVLMLSAVVFAFFLKDESNRKKI